MQPKNNNLNLILFVILSGLILSGSMMFQAWQQSKRPGDARPWLDLYVRAPSSAFAPTVPGLGTALQMATDVQIADWLAKNRYQLPADLIVKREAPPAPPKQQPLKPVIQQPAAFADLGDEDSNLRVRLSSRGAAIVGVTLNQFRAADTNGRPLDEKLELVPEEANKEEGSNLLFHYQSVDDDRPVDTLGSCNWELVSQHKDAARQREEVIFATDVPGLPLRVTKTYTLYWEDYHVGLKVQIISKDSAGKEPVKFRYQITSGHGLPIEGEWYTTVYRNALVGSAGKGKNFWRDFQDSRTIGMKEGGERVVKGDSERIEYGAIATQYFSSAVAVTDKIDPDDPTETPVRQDFLAWARPTVEGELDAKKPFLDDMMMRLATEALEIPAQGSLVHNYILYYGPVKVRLLDSVGSKGKSVSQKLVDRYIYDLHLNTLTDYHTPGAMGSFFSQIGWTSLLIFFTNVMHAVMGWLHTFIPNYGICVIILTLCVRAMMHPVSRKQARTSMKMQALAPEIKKLQEKYKNDRQGLGVEQMALYRKHGVHPMGSCWIVLLQMPIFMGLYYSLQESIFFRLAPFLWIKNLAAPDMLFSWGDKIPFISRPEDQGSIFYLGPYLNLLPVLAVSLMIVQQKYLMPPPTDEQQEMQQKMMKYMMIFMGLMFYKMAAGLCVYFIVSTLWGLAERQLLPKKKANADNVIMAPVSNNGARGRQRNTKETRPDGILQKMRDMWEEVLEQAKKK